MIVRTIQTQQKATTKRSSRVDDEISNNFSPLLSCPHIVIEKATHKSQKIIVKLRNKRKKKHASIELISWAFFSHQPLRLLRVQSERKTVRTETSKRTVNTFRDAIEDRANIEQDLMSIFVS